MSDILLQLGPILFTDFEIPERVTTGGEQRLAIHRLPGGARVIDAMGRDDAEITFAGTFSGADAPARAVLLDTLRAAGQPLTLSWDIFAYTVLIARLSINYAKPWWIPFRLTCTVLQDQSEAVIEALVDSAAMLATDLAGAVGLASAGGIDLAAAAAALPAAGPAGPAATALAATSFATGSETLSSGIAGAEMALAAAPPLTTATSLAGTLANLLPARDQLSRAAANLTLDGV